MSATQEPGDIELGSTPEKDRNLTSHLAAGTEAIIEVDTTAADNTEKVIAKFKQPQIDLECGADKPILHTRGQVGWVEQFCTLSHRNVKELMRKRDILWTNVIQTIIIAVLIGTVFLQIGTTQASLKRRAPLMFFCCINQGVFGSLAVINAFPSERALSLRERAAGSYNVSAYFLSKSLIDSLPQIFYPIIFSTIVYFLVGLRQDNIGHFFVFMAFMMLCNLCATSAALMVSAVCVTTDRSVAVLPMFLEVSRLFGGYFLSPINLPNYFVWLDALSFYKYAFTGVSLNEWRGLTLTCLPGELKNGVCPLTSGDQFIKNEGLDYLSIGGCAGFLIGFIIFTRVVAFFAVKYFKH
eukprot:c16366_g1_i2.p1 GENE.c16366_g1_i2~~c16366_g1_i2.p1  ORF type:complete len:361 (+),score=99.49 c16366_g1_i2:26-1084(+)